MWLSTLAFRRCGGFGRSEPLKRASKPARWGEQHIGPTLAAPSGG